MKTKLIFFTLFACSFTTILQAQEDEEVKDRNFRIEVEPASFIYRGVAASVMYALTEDNNFSLGLFGASLDIPDFTRPNMFNNVGDSDTSKARLGFQIALMARYKIPVFKKWESNPYIGFIGGWEYFDIEQPATTGKVRLSTFVLTPYLGYEFYYFKQMLYVNPQIRTVFYAGKKTDDASRPESLKKFLLLPQVSLGIRL